MFFRRSKAQQEPETPPPESLRKLYRAPVDPNLVKARIVREGSEPLLAGVVDLSLEGIGIEVPFHLDPGYDPGEVVSLELQHTGDSWVVETPAQIEQHHPDGGANVHYGLTFLNMGSLYAQMQNTFGQYFNRRRHERIRVEVKRDISVRLRQKGQKPRGTVFDLSTSGMCVALDLVAATGIQVGQPLEFSFELPGDETTITGQADAILKRKVGQRQLLSLAFNLESDVQEHRAAIHKYVEERAKLLAKFSARLKAG